MSEPIVISAPPARRLSRVLASVTLLLALVLGAVSGAMQILADLRQEKNAVQYSAEEFLASVAPSAASAAYNYYLPAAEQVVEGLFTQRAIASVRIINEGAVMVSGTREVDRTLPRLGGLSTADPVALSVPLMTPNETGRNEQIGEIAITVDRSVVAPSFVNRMLFYFLFATVKNFLLGILLIIIVYGALARHIINLADVSGAWTPSQGPLKINPPPRILRETELDVLGQQLARLTSTAAIRIKEVEASHKAAVQSNSRLSEQSAHLSQEVHAQNIELQRTNARLKELAEMDALTGLHNRGSFDKLAAHAFAAANAQDAPVAVLLLDVDFFKAYNDFYGHQAGDRCLTKVAGVIDDALSPHAEIVARYGGEEFVAFLTGAAAKDAMALADDIHDRLQATPIEHQRSTVAERITISIGVAQSGGAERTLDQIISAADEALYEAKARGRNRSVMSTPAIRDSIRQTRQQANTLLKAIEARDFEPFFQPQYDARTGTLIGAEALVRWRRQDGSFAAPFAFLQTAQENGLLTLIDRIMLEDVADFLARAARDGLPIPRMSLNAPFESLIDASYVDRVLAVQAASETQIALELLETSIFDRPDPRLMQQIDRLRAGGVDIEVDDFGTGHTSIVSLMTLAPSRLKIAKEIVMPMLKDAAHQEIVASIIKMSEALGIEVLAEGVETDAIARKLTTMNCPLQQGYFHARPMPEKAFVDHLSPTALLSEA